MKTNKHEVVATSAGALTGKEEADSETPLKPASPPDGSNNSRWIDPTEDLPTANEHPQAASEAKTARPSNVREMSDNELRVEVAELCGWKAHSWFKGKDLAKDDKWSDPFWSKGTGERTIPDYPADLNAMHEIERKAPAKYWQTLCEITGYGMMSVTYQNARLVAHATARQRAEAFVLTLSEQRSRV